MKILEIYDIISRTGLYLTYFERWHSTAVDRALGTVRGCSIHSLRRFSCQCSLHIAHLPGHT